MSGADTFTTDLNNLLEEALRDLNALAENPKRTELFERIVFNFELASGMAGLAAHEKLAGILREIKNVILFNAGEKKTISEKVYELLGLTLHKLIGLAESAEYDDNKVESFEAEYEAGIKRMKIKKPPPPAQKKAAQPGRAREENDADSRRGAHGSGGLSPHEENIEIPEWDPGAYIDMLDGFIEEAEEILAGLEKNLLDLENDHKNMDLLNTIFRAMHTLKGNSSTMGLKVMGLVAHRAENILDRVRKNSLELSSDIIDIMLECNDVFKEIMTRVTNREKPDIDIRNIIAKLDAVSHGTTIPDTVAVRTESSAENIKDANKDIPLAGKDGAPLPSGLAPQKTTPGPGAEPAARQMKQKIEASSLRIDINKLDSVINLIGEIVIDKIRLKQKVTNMTDLIALIGNIISILEEEEEGIDRLEQCRIIVDDRIGDQLSRLVLDADIYMIHRKEIGSLREIVEELQKGCGDIESFRTSVSTSNIVSELKRIRIIFKEAVQELSFLVEHLSLITNELQEGIMRMRMVPVSQLFDKVPRIVRGLSKELNKKIVVEMIGEDTDLDKTIVEKLTDPLTHLIRNAVDHGIEKPEERAKKGKPEEGTIILQAEHKGNQVEITIEDDGKGINEEKIIKKAVSMGLISQDKAASMKKSEIIDLIFLPGFSSAQAVTETSGRGVGMDVVLNNIKALKGIVDVDTEIDGGTAITIRLPLTMAIMQVQVVSCSKQIFAIPINFIEEVIKINNKDIMQIGPKKVFNLRDEIISLVYLHEILGLEGIRQDEDSRSTVIIVNIADKRIGFIIDHLVGQQEIVIKTLGSVLKNVNHVSGATILGGGNVILILDVLGMFSTARKMVGTGQADYAVAKELFEERKALEAEAANRKKILVVDDAQTMRAEISSALKEAGYEVDEAVNGAVGLSMSMEKEYDLFTVDVIMPNMDGYELTKKLREMPQYAKKPIIMVSSKAEKIDKMRGLDAGADEYLTKPCEKTTLIKNIRKFLD